MCIFSYSKFSYTQIPFTMKKELKKIKLYLIVINSLTLKSVYGFYKITIITEQIKTIIVWG